MHSILNESRIPFQNNVPIQHNLTGMSHRQQKIVSDELLLINNPGVMISMSDHDFTATGASSNNPTFNVTARSMPTVTSARATVKGADPFPITS
jgi:hypothetical protein